MANIIAIVWDFDKTLIGGYMEDPIFKDNNIDSKAFWEEVNSLPQKYEPEQGVRVNPETVYLNQMINYAKEDKFNVVTTETRKGFDEEALLYASAGDDSVPCDNDRLILIKAGNTGEKAAVGSLNESQGAKPGEKILFSRDKNGKVVATMFESCVI